MAAARQEMRAPSHPGGKALGTLAVCWQWCTPCMFASAILLPFVLAIVLYLLLSPLMRFLTTGGCACRGRWRRWC